MLNYEYTYTGYFKNEEEKSGINLNTVEKSAKVSKEIDLTESVTEFPSEKDDNDTKTIEKSDQKITMDKKIIDWILDGAYLDQDGWDIDILEDYQRQGVTESEKFRMINWYGSENHEKTYNF